jgi:hypothetical protein
MVPLKEGKLTLDLFFRKSLFYGSKWLNGDF